MTPTWYDLLGLDPGATTAEVRAAWRAQTADLDPTDRRFKVLNQAAEVLLDDERRAAYDAELAAREPEPVDEPVDEPADEPADEPVDGPGLAEEAEEVEDPAGDRDPGAGGRRIPTWTVLVAAAIAVVLAVLTGYVAGRPHLGDADVRRAQAAAEQAVVPLLSYDYRHLDQDEATAKTYLTGSFADDYAKLFAALADSAAEVKPVVRAQFVASAVTRTGEDRVQVLVFVNQSTTNAQQSEPVVYKNQTTMTMVRQGDRWLVGKLETTAPQG